jgi:nucleotide-binding universal stress UspA family protein
MAIKHILAPVSGDREAPHVALCALKLAEELQAHVTATNIPFSPTAAVIPEATISPGVYSELQRTMDEFNTQRSAKARRFFDNAVALTKTAIVDTPVCARASTTWVDLTTLDNASIAGLSRLSDLVIMDKPADACPVADMSAFEDALFDAKRPVLLLPKGTQEIDCNNVAIAWNGSSEAAQAAKSVLDLITPGARVTIIQVGDIREGRMSSEALVDYLGWHCHAAVVRKVADKPKGTTDILLNEAKAAGAGVLVVGAYSHSRTRELFLGGVTRRLLSSANLPLLMAH